MSARRASGEELLLLEVSIKSNLGVILVNDHIADYNKTSTYILYIHISSLTREFDLF